MWSPWFNDSLILSEGKREGFRGGEERRGTRLHRKSERSKHCVRGTERKKRMNGRLQFVIENVWPCCETLKDCHTPLSREAIHTLVRGNQRLVQWEQSKFQIAFEWKWLMLLSQAWVYGEQQGEVIPTYCSLVLLNHNMVAKGSFTASLGCQKAKNKQ